jgi:hypothetical protein
MAAVQCLNYETNQQLCPCTEVSCERHGICCECMGYHTKSTQWPRTACMGGALRDESTLSLPLVPPEDCPNQETNLDACVCTADCDRRGYCCVCVRNHFKVDGSGATACMRS